MGWSVERVKGWLRGHCCGGIDVMTVRVEHADHESPDAVALAVANAVQTRIAARCEVEVIAPDTLPKTEFKAKRIFDHRTQS